jgi:D-proline reductase (dithiol) PrdB
MAVDSYRWLPRRMAEGYRNLAVERAEPIPWTPLPGPLSTLTLALVTTAGLYVEGREPPFDQERERREPTWGDPSYRTIPRDAPRQGIGASHLHVNNDFVRADLNVALPLDAVEAAAERDRIGAVADLHYSLMGYQLDPTEWEQHYVPELAGRLRDAGVGAALVVPT